MGIIFIFCQMNTAYIDRWLRPGTTKQLLKIFANIITGDETWVHYFETLRATGNKIKLPKPGSCQKNRKN